MPDNFMEEWAGKSGAGSLPLEEQQRIAWEVGRQFMPGASEGISIRSLVPLLGLQDNSSTAGDSPDRSAGLPYRTGGAPRLQTHSSLPPDASYPGGISRAIQPEDGLVLRHQPPVLGLGQPGISDLLVHSSSSRLPPISGVPLMIQATAPHLLGQSSGASPAPQPPLLSLLQSDPDPYADLRATDRMGLLPPPPPDYRAMYQQALKAVDALTRRPTLEVDRNFQTLTPHAKRAAVRTWLSHSPDFQQLFPQDQAHYLNQAYARYPDPAPASLQQEFERKYPGFKQLQKQYPPLRNLKTLAAMRAIHMSPADWTAIYNEGRSAASVPASTPPGFPELHDPTFAAKLQAVGITPQQYASSLALRQFLNGKSAPQAAGPVQRMTIKTAPFNPRMTSHHSRPILKPFEMGGEAPFATTLSSPTAKPSSASGRPLKAKPLTDAQARQRTADYIARLASEFNISPEAAHAIATGYLPSLEDAEADKRSEAVEAIRPQQEAISARQRVLQGQGVEHLLFIAGYGGKLTPEEQRLVSEYQQNARQLQQVEQRIYTLMNPPSKGSSLLEAAIPHSHEAIQQMSGPVKAGAELVEGGLDPTNLMLMAGSGGLGALSPFVRTLLGLGWAGYGAYQTGQALEDTKALQDDPGYYWMRGLGLGAMTGLGARYSASEISDLYNPAELKSATDPANPNMSKRPRTAMGMRENPEERINPKRSGPLNLRAVYKPASNILFLKYRRPRFFSGYGKLR